MVKWRGWYWRRVARRAARARNWSGAAAAYRRLVVLCPQDPKAWIQLGHAYKEGGHLAEARKSYGEAAEVAPDMADAWLQVGRMKALEGDRGGAIQALRTALEINPWFAQAAQDLVSAGARDALPPAVHALHESGDEGECVYAATRYEAWRERYIVPPPPRTAATALGVVIDARFGGDVAVTRASLEAQMIECEPISVMLQDGSLPVGSGALLTVAAGTKLHPAAAAWLLAAAERTGAGAVFCDYEERDEAGTYKPAFQPMFDPAWFGVPGGAPPVLLMVSAGSRRDLQEGVVVPPVKFAHLPLLLAERPIRRIEGKFHPLTKVDGSDRIQVVIQTRDEADALKTSVESLIDFAHRPDLLDIFVVDNRSVEPETARLLDDWASHDIVRVISHDAEFNWARANNRAVGDAEFILFLNNDTEALSIGWDSALKRRLKAPDAGIVGALLLYPNSCIQHAGVVLGMNEGGPLHEGVMQRPEDGGPQERWIRTRCAAAVTGAWMAIRRETFEAIGGFDERFAVAYNDIDLCLRVRAAGLHIMHCAEIVAFHHESLTRGLHLDAAGSERNRAEFQLLEEKWGGALLRDPAYNPHWARSGRPFDGLRFPTIQEINDWLDLSASEDPWSISRQERDSADMAVRSWTSSERADEEPVRHSLEGRS